VVERLTLVASPDFLAMRPILDGEGSALTKEHHAESGPGSKADNASNGGYDEVT